MDKTGWQVTALLLGMLSVGLGLALGANKAALAETERQLTNAKNNKPRTVEVYRTEQLPCPAFDDVTQCRGGVLLRKTLSGWESVTRDGNAVACTVP
jgi:hypothetical protein